MTAKKAPAKVIEFPRATRLAILEAEDRRRELLQIPEWQMSVWIRSLEGMERDRYEGGFVRYGRNAKGSPTVDSITSENTRARLAAMTMVDDDWANLFSEADVLILGHKSAAALERVFKVAQRLSGLTDEDVEALEAQLGEDQSAASGSDSPGTSE